MNVYVDMDGVLADFFGSALRVNNSNGTGYPKGEYQIQKYLNISTNQFWENIDAAGEEFWFDLGMCNGAEELWQIVEPYNPIVLTSPSMQPHCVSGKLKWLQKVFGRDFRDYIFCPAQHKRLLANPNSILIEDGEKNIEQWENNRGFGLLWPHIGNSSDWTIDEALDALISALDRAEKNTAFRRKP